MEGNELIVMASSIEGGISGRKKNPEDRESLSHDNSPHVIEGIYARGTLINQIE
jgi:hypothetical protein